MRLRPIRHLDATLVAIAAAVVFGGASPRPPIAALAGNPHLVTYEGEAGPGRGKHLVFLAGDHEYRSEETLPALARILARRYGFRCSVFFTTDPATGFIEPGSSSIAGLDQLGAADLMVVFLRFQDFPDAEMRHIVDYLERGGPVVGFRTATHAFQIKRPAAPFLKYAWDWKGPGFEGGFGRQILGETWVSHYGRNHQQSSRFVLQAEHAGHPILRGVKNVWVQSGGYTADPAPGSQVLALGRILDGMTPGSPPAKGKTEQPVAWVRSYRTQSGAGARVFTTTHGASEDLLDEGFRRMSINGILWAAGLEDAIRPDGAIGFVGPFRPSTFSFGGFVKGMKPIDVAGWDAAIPPGR
jgi:type 1 glutamine amidotransferase